MTHPSHARTRRGARLVGIGIIVSRLFGLVRGWLFARYFGGGAEADAYYQALKVPNALRNLLGDGAISASFVPVYAAAVARGDERGARALANALLGVLLVGVALLTALGIFAAPLLTALIAPGFEPVRAELTTRLMRVLFPMTGLMVLSGWCLGVQNAHRRFFVAYASAAAWSLTQIVLLAFAGAPGKQDLVRLVWWLSWATVGGAILQIATQLPQVVRLMGSIRPTLSVAAPGLQATFRNFIPVVSALGLFQISGLIDTTIASILPKSAPALIGYATNLYLLPLSLFGVSAAAASLTEFAGHNVAESRDLFRDGLIDAWERVLFYVIPSTVAFIAIGDLIIALLYRSGKFGPVDQYVVHLILAGFAIALLAYASSRVLTATYYALQDYRTPFRSSAVAILISAAGSLAFALPYRSNIEAAAGIAAGGALGAYVNLFLLVRGLRGRLGALNMDPLLRVCRLAGAASVVAAAFGVAAQWALGSTRPQAIALVVIPLYCMTFMLVARLLGLEEAKDLMAGVRSRLIRR